MKVLTYVVVEQQQQALLDFQQRSPPCLYQGYLNFLWTALKDGIYQRFPLIEL
ncbi:MAG: hypothetical protein VX070_02860 [Bacteroidota bacterium]|nr:hypothetical protein [Bacteroidota bacterium]